MRLGGRGGREGEEEGKGGEWFFVERTGVPEGREDLELLLLLLLLMLGVEGVSSWRCWK